MLDLHKLREGSRDHQESPGTLQNRLTKMMRLDGVNTLEEGNRYAESFRLKYNARFGKVPESREDVHRPLPKRVDLDRILVRKETRKVTKNLELSYQNTIYQLEARGKERRLAGKTALILEHEDAIGIEIDGKAYDYKVFHDSPYQERVMDRKYLDAFLDRKLPMTAIARSRRQKQGR